MRPPFLSGSHAYGIPNEKSDVDIVVYFCNFKELDGLELFIGHKVTQLTNEATRFMCKHGVVNYIIFCDPALYDLWLQVTNELIAIKPVTREVACAAFNQVGLTGGSATK